jgi:uncharacterized protein DUF3606
MVDNPAEKGERDRCHIAMTNSHKLRHWTRHLGVSKDELRRMVDRVGNSAAAVKKELKSQLESQLKNQPVISGKHCP